MDPFGAGAALHRPDPLGHISSAHRAERHGASVGRNVTDQQEKKNNKETKTGKRRAGENRKQATDFKKAVRYPSAVVQGAAQRRNEGECPGLRGPSGSPTAILTQPKTGSGTAPPR